jgi:diaminohydroxyphosphoribosylaminopyrimidine deaminase/5-amino-6-(5-phosphoribosylamino)uracil reductase
METQAYWRALLALADILKKTGEEVHFCVLTLADTHEVAINRFPENPEHAPQLTVLLEADAPEAGSGAVFRLSQLTAAPLHTADFSEEAVRFFRLYLPYCFLPLRARQKGRALAVSHFAQSLDGRIATDSGDSKWIGNDENLVHAHRMRALCDGILIGANTLNADHPALTVRLVEGANPRRIVLCSSEADFSSLQRCRDEVLLVGSCEDPQIPQTTYKRFSTGERGRIDCHQLLQYLYSKGIYSVYVEGGASTTSGFIEDEATDVIQLHFSPLIFGSGISSFSLPEIRLVDEAVSFVSFYFYPMGDSCMFVGEMKQDWHG